MGHLCSSNIFSIRLIQFFLSFSRKYIVLPMLTDEWLHLVLFSTEYHNSR
jgi:hypothetical protein